MTIKATIRNDEPEAGAQHVKVTVVTVGGSGSDVQERHELLAPGAQTTVTVGPGQFVMLDDKEA